MVKYIKGTSYTAWVVIFEAKNTVYPMWNDVRTYLTSEIDPQEKSSLLHAISHFKTKERGKAMNDFTLFYIKYEINSALFVSKEYNIASYG